MFVYVYYNLGNIPVVCVSWGLPNHQMVYNICFIPKTKRTNSHKQYQQNNILFALKTLRVKLCSMEL